MEMWLVGVRLHRNRKQWSRINGRRIVVTDVDGEWKQHMRPASAVYNNMRSLVSGAKK